MKYCSGLVLIPCGELTTHLELITCTQTWALALFFQVRSPLSAQFLPRDRYSSTAHFEDFQVRSSLNRSQTDQWFALRKARLKFYKIL